MLKLYFVSGTDVAEYGEENGSEFVASVGEFYFTNYEQTITHVVVVWLS